MSTVVDSAQKQIILRQTDRNRLINVLNTLNVCVTAFSPASMVFYAQQRQIGGKFTLLENTQTSFLLDSRDFLYFSFTSPLLSINQQITLNVQAVRANNTSSPKNLVLVTPPKVAMFVCKSSVET